MPSSPHLVGSAPAKTRLARKTEVKTPKENGVIDGLRFVVGVIGVYFAVNTWQLGQLHVRNLRGSRTVADSAIKQFKATKLILAATCAWTILSSMQLLRHTTQANVRQTEWQ